MDSDGLALTNRLLKVIIAVLIKGGDQQMSLKQQIETLDNLGLKPKDIAEILGKTNTHVSKELTAIRKKGR
jgi:hypothetical protein